MFHADHCVAFHDNPGRVDGADAALRLLYIFPAVPPSTTIAVLVYFVYGCCLFEVSPGVSFVSFRCLFP